MIAKENMHTRVRAYISYQMHIHGLKRTTTAHAVAEVPEMKKAVDTQTIHLPSPAFMNAM